MRDEKNKKAHEHSAQLACEAAGSIRTVAALTREDDCCNSYSESLEEPLKNARRAALRSGVLYGLAQAMGFWVISLIFWYGARLVSTFEYTPFEFFVALMVRVFFLHFLLH
jgi:ATP-binding cassette subfamily B (MDR/TAP) protein 1